MIAAPERTTRWCVERVVLEFSMVTEEYRRLALEGRRRSASASDAGIKGQFERVAEHWFELAHQVEALERRYGSLAFGPQRKSNTSSNKFNPMPSMPLPHQKGRKLDPRKGKRQTLQRRASRSPTSSCVR
jgi:hypothetical protein